FARKLVNSGRLSMPASYLDSPLNTPDADDFSAVLAIGAVAPDGPITIAGERAWWLGRLGGGFVVAVFCTNGVPDTDTLAALSTVQHGDVALRVVLVLGADCPDISVDGMDTVRDSQGLLASRYDARDGACYLI